MARVDRDEWGFGDALLSDMALQLSQRYLPSGWGLSFGCHITEELAVPYELSVTQSPAYWGARVLGVGAESFEVYELLTGIELAAAQQVVAL